MLTYKQSSGTLKRADSLLKLIVRDLFCRRGLSTSFATYHFGNTIAVKEYCLHLAATDDQ